MNTLIKLLISIVWLTSLYAQNLTQDDISKFRQLFTYLNHDNNKLEYFTPHDYQIYSVAKVGDSSCMIDYKQQRVDSIDTNLNTSITYRIPLNYITYNALESRDYIDLYMADFQLLYKRPEMSGFQVWGGPSAVVRLFVPVNRAEINQLISHLKVACKTTQQIYAEADKKYQQMIQSFYTNVAQNNLSTVRYDLEKDRITAGMAPAAFSQVKSDEMARLLGAYRFDINYQNPDIKMTPLQYAIKAQDSNKVRILLENGANPTIKDLWTNNAFHTLAIRNNLDLTQTFFNYVDNRFLDEINYVNKNGCRALNYVTNKEVKKSFKNNDAKRKIFGCKSLEESVDHKIW